MTSTIRIKTETRECQGKDPSQPWGLGEALLELWEVEAAVVLVEQLGVVTPKNVRLTPGTTPRIS